MSYLQRNELSLLQPSLLVSILMMNCSSVSFLCLVSIYIYVYIYMYGINSRTIGVVVRMSILDTKFAGSNLSINMFSP